MEIKKKLLIILIMLTMMMFVGCINTKGNSQEQEQEDILQEQQLLLNGISLTRDIISSVYRGERYTYEALLFALAVNDDENNLYKGYFPFDEDKGWFIFPIEKSNEVLIQVFGEKEYPSFDDVFDYDEESDIYYKNLDFGWNTPYIAENVTADISDDKLKLYTKFELINLWYDVEGDPVPTAIADCEITYSINKSDDKIYLQFENMEIKSKIEATSEYANDTNNINQVSSLKDFTPDQLEKIKITEKDGDRILIDDYLSSAKIISDTEAIFTDNNYQAVRNSSQALYSEGFDDGYDNLINTNISEMEFTNFDNFQSPYNLSKSDTIVIFDELYDDAQIKVKDIIYGYTAEDITLNGFVRKNSNYIFDIIVDPAYMYGLPVYHSDSSLGEFTINGLNIKSDTINFEISDFDKNFEENLEALNIDYAYAQITFDKINCIHGINSGYKSTASIKDFKLITEDTEKVLTRAFLFENAENKNPEMVQVYNTLMSNMDIINTDMTLGIILLDLDFDNTPEVLVTKYSTDADVTFGNAENEVADVDIYRIENDNLVYIDTLYNYHTVVYELGNILGLKTLEDGSKAWFNMSYKNRDTKITSDTDYLFTLNGNELKFQEVFGIDADGNYRYFGEPMIFVEETSIFGDLGDRTLYSWGDYEQMIAKWAIVGEAKQDYCEDMKETSFNLYSNWLSHTETYSKSYKLPLTDRMLSYNIAYLVDSFYLGSYNANTQYFEYRFLGDYAKPVIYLYPTVQTDISVKIDIDGILTCTYPEYNNGWNVTANPDGTLINKADGREYSYLYWEGKGNTNWDFSKGFVVKGTDTVSFLQEKLEYLGLTARELNEFIVYWLPLMKDNKYNLITFQTTAYENNAKLEISPKPDNVLRVFMAYKALDKYIEIPEQQINTFNRSGFTVVEWGGTEVK